MGNVSNTSESKLPFLTVMMPVRNEARFIGATLKQLLEQNYPKNCFEIIVVDGESDDETAAIVKKFSSENLEPQIKLLSNPNRLSSSARNIAVKNAKGDYILLIDGHVYIPTPDLLLNYVEAISASNALVLGRPQPLTPPKISLFQQAVALTRSSALAHSRESFIYSDYEGFTSPISIGVMYHRSVFSRVGFFDESFDAAEDLEFNYRLEKMGYKCFTSPKLTVKYYPRENLCSLFNQLKRYGAGRARFVKKHPERFTIETLVPALFFIAVSSTPMIILSLPLFRFLWCGCALCYFLAISICSCRIVPRRCLRTAVLIPLIIMAIHLGMGWGLLKGTWEMSMKKYLLQAFKLRKSY